MTYSEAISRWHCDAVARLHARNQKLRQEESRMDYATIDAVNISSLKALITRSPKHYRYELDHPRESSAEMEIGTATHVLVLQPERFSELYVVRPDGLDGRTKDGKAALADLRASGRKVLTQDDERRIRGMAEAIADDERASEWLHAEGKVEHAITWTDAETGMECKGRIDLLTDDGCLVGLKTTRDISERMYFTQATRLLYHAQWAFYYDGLCALGQKPRVVVEVAVENQAPFDCDGGTIIEEDVLDEGRAIYREALVTLKRCRELDIWPGKVPQPRVFRLPAWAQHEDEDDMDDLDMSREGAP
jgi:hypothetical protein